MSIETDLSRIASALEQLVTALSNKAPTVAAPAAVVQPSPVTGTALGAVAYGAPVQMLAPVQFTQQPQAMAQAPAPVPVSVVPAGQTVVGVSPAMTSSPFGKQEDGTDHTITTYVMATYRALGPINGAKIQGVLTGLGYTNINEVKPEHYGQFFAGVEALKVPA